MPLLNPSGILPAPTNREGSVVTVTPQDRRDSCLLVPAHLSPWNHTAWALAEPVTRGEVASVLWVQTPRGVGKILS